MRGGRERREGREGTNIDVHVHVHVHCACIGKSWLRVFINTCSGNER